MRSPNQAPLNDERLRGMQAFMAAAAKFWQASSTLALIIAITAGLPIALLTIPFVLLMHSDIKDGEYWD